MQWSWVGDGGVVDASRFFFGYISLSLSFCLGCSVCSQGAAAGPCTIQWRDQNVISKSLLSTHWPGRTALAEKGAAFAESGGMNLLIAQSQCWFIFFGSVMGLTLFGHISLGYFLFWFRTKMHYTRDGNYYFYIPNRLSSLKNKDNYDIFFLPYTNSLSFAKTLKKIGRLGRFTCNIYNFNFKKNTSAITFLKIVFQISSN